MHYMVDPVHPSMVASSACARADALDANVRLVLDCEARDFAHCFYPAFAIATAKTSAPEDFATQALEDLARLDSRLAGLGGARLWEVLFAVFAERPQLFQRAWTKRFGSSYSRSYFKRFKSEPSIRPGDLA